MVCGGASRTGSGLAQANAAMIGKSAIRHDGVVNGEDINIR